MWAIVPLKYLADAKSRLRDVLSSAERQQLVRCMARDVLSALAATPSLTGIIIASRDAEVPMLAEEFDAEVFIEPSSADLSQSVAAASSWAQDARGAQGTLIVHADIPLASAADFTALLAAHEALSMVPDDEDRGTNCIVATPPNPFPFRYDGNSFGPHLAAAEAAGLAPRVCRIANLQLDIDTETDLKRLIAAQSTCETGTYLEVSGIAQRLGSPHNG